jgi:glycine/D-amino acid oxidase-like deaminating enzyme
MEQMLYVSAFANNHYAGFAPATARRLAELVLGTAPPLPDTSPSLAAPGATLFDPPHDGIE